MSFSCAQRKNCTSAITDCVTRPVKRARISSESAANSPFVSCLFVQVCSDVYEGAVPDLKVHAIDPMDKSRDQFVCLEGPRTDAKDYMQLANELVDQGQITYLPILVDISNSSYQSQCSAEEAAKYVRMSSR